MTLLAGRALRKSFGSRLVLDSADLTIAAGEGGYTAWLERPQVAAA